MPESSSTVRILTEAELRRCVDLDLDTVDVVADAFTALATRQVDMPPIQHISVAGDGPAAAGGDVDVKSAFIPGLDFLAIKIATGFFGNASLGLPTGNGLMTVLDAHTGRCAAVLLDNGYLTDVRTAAAGAVAARHLAPGTVDTAGVLGTGRQAELQMRALHLVRPFGRLLIHGRNVENARNLQERLGTALPSVDIEVLSSVRAVVQESDCLVTTTASTSPLIDGRHLPQGPVPPKHGLHITAMGSDLPGKQELDVEVLRRADVCVWDRESQCARLGELQHVPVELRGELKACELGELTAGLKPGRRDDHELTVCDLTGTGVQDTAIAVHALRRAEALGLGTQVGD